jgi:hypothetical protein
MEDDMLFACKGQRAYGDCRLRDHSYIISTRPCDGVNVKQSDKCMSKGLWVMVFNATFQQYFSYIVAVNLIFGGNRSTRRKPPTCRKSLTNFYHIMLYRVYSIKLNILKYKTDNV